MSKGCDRPPALAENPRDRVAAFRVLQLLPGVGAATARKAIARMEAAGWAFSALMDLRPPPAAREQWPDLASTTDHPGRRPGGRRSWAWSADGTSR